MFHVHNQIRWFSYAVPRNKLKKILVANRGEIACRVMRTAKRLGVKTVAVYSNVDCNALHVHLADEAYYLGPASSKESYLNATKVTNAAQITRADAIHPGYGFLSENAEFADMCNKLGIVFIGPPATAIRDMGMKSISKNIMSSAGVPVILGYHGEDQSDSRLQNEAKKIGFPVMIKAVRGGGGKGMRIAMTEAEFRAQLDSAKREAEKSFGDSEIIIEKFIERPRHIEVQIFGDTHGNYVYLFERDCSVQRRYQKIIEEAPAPNLSVEERQSLGKAAVQAAKAVNYVGAGTVEFVMDKYHKFYFMEMNTRLQVEHPVTEMITGIDLVEWQLQVASGGKLPLTQQEIKLNGHSFEARIYAEDPYSNFMPQAGPLLYFHMPDYLENIRIESGVCQGDDVTIHYDPMIAKLVVWGPDRTSALLKLHQALSECHVIGLPTNVTFLMDLARHNEFAMGNVNTDFINEHKNELLLPKQLTNSEICVGVLSLILQCRYDALTDALYDPFSVMDGMVPNCLYVKTVCLSHKNEEFCIQVSYGNGGNYAMTLRDRTYRVWGVQNKDDSTKILGTVDNHTFNCRVIFMNGTLHIFTKDNSYELKVFPSKSPSSLSKSFSQKDTVAPMPGIIEKIMVSVGDEVKSGDSIIVMTAMKMEYVIKANSGGIVENILCKVGDSVGKSAELVKIKKDD